MFARALGARDVALGGVAGPGTDLGQASMWLAAGAISDTLEVMATQASWQDLSPLGRWLVADSASGAALIGAAAAASLHLGRPPA